jgi:hypothetical protein
MESGVSGLGTVSRHPMSGRMLSRGADATTKTTDEKGEKGDLHV